MACCAGCRFPSVALQPATLQQFHQRVKINHIFETPSSRRLKRHISQDTSSMTKLLSLSPLLKRTHFNVHVFLFLLTCPPFVRRTFDLPSVTHCHRIPSLLFQSSNQSIFLCSALNDYLLIKNKVFTSPLTVTLHKTPGACSSQTFRGLT